DALSRRELTPIAVRGDRLSAHILHREEWAALRRGTGIEDLRDGRMRHDCQCLTLRFEARDDLRRVHAGFDDLEGDLSVNGLRLLGEPDLPHAAFAKTLQ